MTNANSPFSAPCFLVGIGGSGMMPLAMILRARGVAVSGSDRGLDQGRLAPKFDALRAAGIALYSQDGGGVCAGHRVIASAAVEESVPDIVAATALGCARQTRAAALAELFNAAALPIAVAGTSGKSTVTGMIAWILHATGRDPTVMNGAVMKNFVGPDAPFASALVGGGDAFVTEVDESDRSIALYHPRIAVLNNVSLDHMPIEDLRALFGDFAGRARHVVANAGDAETLALLGGLASVTTFAVEGDADLSARALVPDPFAIRFELVAGDTTIPVRLAVPGRHNVSNALAAIGAAAAAGVPIAEAAAAIAGFVGLKRRFELVGEAAGVAVIDDFAHNPDKIAATLDTLHAFPGRVLILFQPHGYGPLKVMREELVRAFVERLGVRDVLVMPDPVYHGGTVAREVGSAEIVEVAGACGCNAHHIADRDDAAAMLAAEARAGDRIVVMGARDDTLSALAARIVAALDLHGGATSPM